MVTIHTVEVTIITIHVPGNGCGMKVTGLMELGIRDNGSGLGTIVNISINGME